MQDVAGSNVALVEPCGPIEASIRPPGSKSITNRALVCAALATGTSHLDGVLDSEDTQVMLQAWKQLGLQLEHDSDRAHATVRGCGGELNNLSAAEIFVANSGTTVRFLCAALAACGGDYQLDGVARMRERPIEDLLVALEELGVSVERLNQERTNCPPVRIVSDGLSGGVAKVSGGISSQFLSGLMMAAPLAHQDVRLEVSGELVSVPYVKMTASVMRSFGINVEEQLPRSITIPGKQAYRPISYGIEPDASAASYFWAAAAISGGRATVIGLNGDSLQGDVQFCRVLEKMGCRVDWASDEISVSSDRKLVGLDVDMADISDTVQTLAAVALFANSPTRVRGVAHNRVKETDRIGDLATELRRLGAEVEEFEDGFNLVPPSVIKPSRIQTYNDHRMAMSLSLVGLRAEGIEIENPGCTGKTYPRFWDDLARFSGSRIRGCN
ncbi:MAG: 3-phosphoshikimate 1-carboxyvinyltransferase [Aureliella sp.]